jgi:hypothetical protein
MVPNHPNVTEAPALSPRQQRWVLVGLIVQPVVAALFGFVTWPILEVTRLPPHAKFTRDTLGNSVAVAFHMFFVGFFVAFCAALPLFLWLRSRGPITFRKTLVSGALLGNLPIAFVLLLTALRALLLVAFPALGGPPPTPTPMPMVDPFVGMTLAAVYPTAIGLTCAAVFWRIVGPHLRAS